MNNNTIIVVGAGIGGLSTALALQRRKIKVKVFERDESFDCRSQGYSLTLQQGMMALDSLGVGQQVRELASSAITAHQIMKSDGQVLACFDVKLGTKKGKGNTPIPRELLRRVLMEALEPDTIHWNKQLTDFEENEELNSVKVTFSDGTVEYCDGLIGCDGIHSYVRKKLIGDPIIYLGVVAVNGIVDIDHELTENRVVQMLDGSTRMFIKPYQKGSSMWQLTFPVSIDEVDNFPFTDYEQARAIALQKVSGWSEPIPQMIASTELSLMRAGPIYDREPLDPWKTRRITILGDSAHAMTPFKGQGANQALEDAVDIANLLVEHNGNVIEAFAEFEVIMLNRSRRFQIGSRRSLKFLHTRDALDTSLLFKFLNLHGEQAEEMKQVVNKMNNSHNS